VTSPTTRPSTASLLGLLALSFLRSLDKFGLGEPHLDRVRDRLEQLVEREYLRFDLKNDDNSRRA